MSRKRKVSPAVDADPQRPDAAPDADVAASAQPMLVDDAAPASDPMEAQPPIESEALPLDDDADGPGLEKAQPVSVSRQHLKSVLESLIFVSDKPVPPNVLARASRSKAAEVRELVQELSEEYRGRGIELSEVAGGYQFRSAPVNAPFVRDFVAQRPVRLTRAQLETLAIVAYRQPVTRPEVDDIRGVDTGSAFKVLLERGLIKVIGRKEDAGRPLLFGTAPFFLEFFGLASLKDLPTLKDFSELTDESRALFERRMGVPIGDLNEPTPAHDGAESPEEEPFDEEAFVREAEASAESAPESPPETVEA